MAKHPKVNKFMNMIDKLKYSHLVLITSIPFSPSFFINLGAGLSNVNSKKYFCAVGGWKNVKSLINYCCFPQINFL